MASNVLHLKPHPKTVLRTSFRLFSSSSSSPSSPTSAQPEDGESTQNNAAENTRSSKPSISSYFSDVKSVLKQHSQQSQQSQHRFRPEGFSFTRSSINPSPLNKPSKVPPIDEIMKNLGEFRRQSAAAPPPIDGQSPSQSQSQSQPISFHELYKKNVANNNSSNLGGNNSKQGASWTINAIREIVHKAKNSQPSDGAKGASESTSRFRHLESLKLRPTSGTGNRAVFGGTSENLPVSVFGKEMVEREKKEKVDKERMKTMFVRNYDYDELGEKLRKLRSEGMKKQGVGGGEKQFSLLSELNDRLARLRRMEEEKSLETGSADVYDNIRGYLSSMQTSTIDSKRKTTMQRLDVLGHLGGTPSFMLEPPKEHLVEKYFHPDNMSSAEKLKLELRRVRDEFKLHESDCGSTQVQIAQLTTEISHLSKLLHKKDKHSRRGLQAKVQQRKSLLKYLRRTDWDSYCFILSKLGLRDNPGYKL